MNPTLVMTEMGSLCVPPMRDVLLARIPQGKFTGEHCVDIVVKYQCLIVLGYMYFE